MNLTLLFDGTWNDPQDRTNVFRLCTSLADHAKGRGRQRFFYDPGVGTNRLTRLRGGLFGYGLSRHLRKGYDWLARHYARGDRIFIFGFSRGAYTARSLVGLIRKCGLDLTPCTPPDQALTIAPRDSFAEFMGGTYQWFARRFKPGNGRHIRKYDTDPDGNPAINVTVDPSVWERWHRDPAYRPLTLVNKGLTPPRLLKT
jgi:hypothetical protein